MFKATMHGLSVYIGGPKIELTECHHIAFPRFHGKFCIPSSLIKDQKRRLEAAFETAQEIAERFNNDGRTEATEKEILKAFHRTFHFHDYWNG